MKNDVAAGVNDLCAPRDGSSVSVLQQCGSGRGFHELITCCDMKARKV